MWGNNSTVIIKLPTDIEFYDGAADSQSYKAVNTPWVSYAFSKPEESLDVWSAFVEKEYGMFARIRSLDRPANMLQLQPCSKAL